ncbi:protein rep, partial [Xenorhabdus nematophila]
RKEFKPVQGWIRSTEVTLGKNGSAHPHFHTLMMVPPSMLSGDGYVKHYRWIELWRDCLRIDYDPNIDVRVVKPKRPKEGELQLNTTADLIRGAVSETLKYSTKPSDMVANPAWFLELTRQTFKRRFIATGGALKDVLKLDQETNEDLILADDMEDGSDDGSRLAFGWKISERRYRRLPERDGKKSD